MILKLRSLVLASLMILPSIHAFAAERDIPPLAHPGCKPPYPKESRESHEHGIVEVRMSVDVDGHVTSVALVKSSGFTSLDDAATKKFKPCDMPQKFDAKGNPIPYSLIANLEFQPDE